MNLGIEFHDEFHGKLKDYFLGINFSDSIVSMVNVANILMKSIWYII